MGLLLFGIFIFSFIITPEKNVAFEQLIIVPPHLYPFEALKLWSTEKVKATLTIDQRGYASETTIEKVSKTILEKAVRDIVKDWRFMTPVDKVDIRFLLV